MPSHDSTPSGRASLSPPAQTRIPASRMGDDQREKHDGQQRFPRGLPLRQRAEQGAERRHADVGKDEGEQGQRPAVAQRLPKEHDGRRKEKELRRQDDAQPRRSLAEQYGLDRRGQEQQPRP